MKPGGTFLVNEYHPFRRMWTDSDGTAPSHRYFDRGPDEYQSDEGVPSFEYNWTVADHVQAVLDAGCILVKIDEYGEEKDDDLIPPDLHWLPTYLVIVGRKPHSR